MCATKRRGGAARFARVGALGAAMAVSALVAGCGANPVRDVAVSTGFGAKPPEPAGFVKESRSAEVDYLPIGQRQPPRRIKPKTPEEAKALEEQLDAQRKANEEAAAQAKALGSAPAPQPGSAPAQ
ncbi:hypothetical protein QNA08_01380 [Chelatococcus sp. SYSU_G07232]|uniref:Beta-barrel assembly machine subunit BamF n=1 Tax=Chelatococcus albus TaxID=3047466 RepID=A0ABT7ADM4_9HYPH|nr:hypothetical protein [Chelatococcus sp. SYSU_G07232]MDJ1156894.1 hypothetical protein [Chelatococcus sp. SYSU_G07232]